MKSLFSQANDAFRGMRYEEAITLYEQVLRDSPWFADIVASNLAEARAKVHESAAAAPLVVRLAGQAERYFDAEWYGQLNPDVVAEGLDPYQHYVHFGCAELRAARYFDADWYLEQYPDIAQAGLDPYEHFLNYGSVEGRHARYFDSRFYLSRNSDVHAGGLEPYAHYLMFGKAEGRIAFPDNQQAAIVLDQHNKYSLTMDTRAYTYVAPAAPYDLAQTVQKLKRRPRFTIVVPAYNTPLDLLEKLLLSVRGQWYPDWDMIIVNDASPSEESTRALSAIDDPRITVVHLAKNSGIAGATNEGLRLAQGDFVVLLDHDDELTPDCLFELACCIDREDPDYIYSDEDKIDPQGKYVEPHFKPDWSPDTMMSTMYVCHVVCIRRTLLLEVGGFRSDYDGCQDWDLILRVTEKTNRICHIPKVLYHWRIIPASIASDIAAKPYVLAASKRVREDALRRRSVPGTVEPIEGFAGYFRVNYHLQGTPLISIIIPSRDNGRILEQCIHSIDSLSSYRNYEIIVVDNGSIEPNTLAYLRSLHLKSHCSIIRHDAPFNFSELNNIAVRQSHGDILLFLNDDTEVISPDWLERIGGYAQQSHVGAVGAKLLYPGAEFVQHAGVLNLQDGPGHAFLRQRAEHPGYFLRTHLEYNWLAVTGACLAVTREKFLQVGCFDETLPVAYNDIELCMRLSQAGYFNVVCQAVRLIHHESISRGVDHMSEEKRQRLARDKRRLYETHPQFFQRDPFYNPNLHPNGLNFEYVF